MNHIYRLIFITTVMAASACSTVSKPISELVVTPNDRINWISYDHADAAKVFIARDKGFTGSAARAIVELNGKSVGTVHNGEVLEISVRPGSHLASVTIQTPFGENLFRPRSLSFDAAKNSETIIRVGFDNGIQGVSVWLASK